MPDQLALFDLPPPPPAPAQAAPAAPRQAKGPRPAPGSAAPRSGPERPAQTFVEDPLVLRARRAAEQAAALAEQRAEHLRRCAAHPAPGLPARTVQALVRVGVSYVGSRTAQAGDASGEGTALHVVEALFRPASGRSIVEKTTEGVAALLAAMDLPDDLLAAGWRRYGHPHYITSLGEDGGVGISCAFATLELNIAAAREIMAARERIAAGEAERAATKGKKRR